MDFGFFGQSLAVQVALAAGYLGYCTAYAGYRRGHLARDAIFISLAFASIASIAFVMTEEWGLVLAGCAAVVVSLAAASLWRVWGCDVWLKVMRATRVHREDGVNNTWESIVQTKRVVGQLSVHTKDGRILYLSDRSQFLDAPWEGLYLGGDGSVVMAVEKEELPDGTEEVRLGVNSEWGTRMTYIPAGEIRRVNIRME